MTKNDSSKPTNIHDAFFLTTFSDLTNTRDFLLAELPRELVAAIDFSTIQTVPSTHQKKSGQKIYSDFVVKAELKKESYPVDIYVLFEHKSTQSSEIFIQLLSYMTAMWREDQKNTDIQRGKSRYRIIIPLVFYHGETRWKIPRNFHDIFSVDDVVKRNLLNFSYALFDTNEWNLDDEQHLALKNNIKLFTAMIALKAVYSSDAYQLLLKMLKFAIDAGFAKDKKGYILVLTEYVSQTLKLDEDEFWGLIEESDLEREDIMPTFVETWEQRGVERGIRQGIKQGIEKGMYAVAKQMLSEGADIQFIARVTKLPITEIQKLQTFKR